MSGVGAVPSSVDTVNAAATAIVTAESRVQPSSVQKRRWGSCLSLYWCFGSNKNSKRIGHAVLIAEPSAQASIAPVTESRISSTTIVMPFIAPPSSPASFLPSVPPSGTQSPATGVLSLASLSVHAYSPGRTAPIYTIGPYAHETQLVSPPIFSTYNTEPSTANFTPPPEPVQMTTPSSPEVPFAELLSSSLARSRRDSGTNLKYSFSNYEFQPYQYPGSPGGNTKSPGSAVSTSGTSSPFPDKAPKYIGYEHFTNYKWGSRVGSGSLTPNGWGSRLGTGTSTPNGGVSRLGSGNLTPNGGLSRLGSGTLTPNGGEAHSHDGNLPEVASLANSNHFSDDILVDHRVSFEIIGDDIPTCVIREPSHTLEAIGESTNEQDLAATIHVESFGTERNLGDVLGTALDEACDEFNQKNRTISLGSSKDFNFNNAKGEEASEKSAIDCEWWTKDKAIGTELTPQDNWTFFPVLQPGVS